MTNLLTRLAALAGVALIIASSFAEASVQRVVDAESGVTAVVVEDEPLIHSAQHFGALELIDDLGNRVRASGGEPSKMVKLHVVAKDLDVAQKAREKLEAILPADQRPAMTFVVGALPVADAAIGIDFVAARGETGVAEQPQGQWFGSPAATLPPGPSLYISGQAQPGTTPQEATRKTIATLLQTLERAGGKRTDIVQAKCFLTPIRAAESVAAEFDRALGGLAVPLVFVEWQSDRPIEIELIAHASQPAEHDEVLTFIPPATGKPSPVFAHATRIDSPKTIYFPGLVSAAPGDGEAQAVAIFERLASLLEQCGSDLKHLAKATYYVSDADASRKLNEVRPRFYDPARPPAASKAMVPGVGAAGRSLSIDMIAVPAASNDID